MTSDLDSALYRRPGFMIRRAHQIATSIFVEEAAALEAVGARGVTTTQFGLLMLLQHCADLDQITASRLLGLDRSTTGMVLNSLEAAGLVERRVGQRDRRQRTLALTPEGHALLAALQAPAARAVERLLAPLDPAERPVLLHLLSKLTGALNETARVPLLTREPG